MKGFKRILLRTGASILIATAGILLYVLLGIISESRAFAPVQVVPLLTAVFLVSVRIGVVYGLIPSLLPPIYNIFLRGIEPDPTNTPFILTVIILFELLFLLILSRILKIFIKNGIAISCTSYITCVAITFLALKFGLFPFLPLLSLPTILQNFLFGSVIYVIIGFLLFIAAGTVLFNMKTKLFEEVG